MWAMTFNKHTMNIILFDDQRYDNLLPLTHTRPVSALRCGILTLAEKWNWLCQQTTSSLSRFHLQQKFPLVIAEDNLLINAGLFPNPDIWTAIQQLNHGECLLHDNEMLALRLDAEGTQQFDGTHIPNHCTQIAFEGTYQSLKNLWDIFSFNDMAIRADYKLLTEGRTSAPISNTNTILGHDIFIEEGAIVACSIINTQTGPVYIGKDVEIMEGTMLRGPIALCEQSVLKMGAKVYGATTLGPGCKVGGEVNNVVFQANANKAHDGFLGNAVIGEWCNLGADANNSNLKNNYEEVKLWSESANRFVKTGLQFCGLIMGDHSKCGINTMFNTGTVVGVSCNIYGAGFPRNFIPSFSWGSANGFVEYQLAKANDTAARVLNRRKLIFDDVEQNLMAAVFERTREQRNY
jgi:UDP-N-acetylglucosamine diphosphorylase/glucosamine-1-phosphate N-acetyltransferase